MSGLVYCIQKPDVIASFMLIITIIIINFNKFTVNSTCGA
jgi:hypothetical protein